MMVTIQAVFTMILYFEKFANARQNILRSDESYMLQTLDKLDVR